jgi:aryl-alcohol dehydrogenase-like predicted oxidoreductase
MDKQEIPGTELSVSPLCFGCGSLGTGAKGDVAEELVAAFVAAGGNFFDTAHCYAFWAAEGAGASERELGRCLRELGVEDRCVVATKGGHPAGPGYERPADFLAERVIVADIEESLHRLGRDVIDLYYLHRDDGVTSVGEIVEILNREISRGRIRYCGASNWSVERIAEANQFAAERGLQGFCVSQVQWSLAVPNWFVEEPGPDPVHRAVGAKEFAFHAATQMPVAAFSATVGGYFAGNSAGNHLYANPANAARRERAEQLAAERGVTPTQMALAWLLAQPFLTFPVFATNRVVHLQEILGSVAVLLTEAEVRWLREGDEPDAPP